MGAEEFIHIRLLELKANGVAIFLISEELDELTNLCDRISVIFKGKILETLSAEDATRSKLGLLMAGIKQDAQPIDAGVQPIDAQAQPIDADALPIKADAKSEEVRP